MYERLAIYMCMVFSKLSRTLMWNLPPTTFAHLDATTVLSRGLAAKDIYPAVDPLDSTSTMLQPRIRIVGEDHYETAQRVEQTLQRYKEFQDIIAIPNPSCFSWY
ncbi:hypothetical protein AG4045_030788 [Apium graveolens]|uniref:H(+)-transporting two-sector ATPase n=1 Tax=Apium graveolens TaxID=4045 RepID=A0A6L5B8I5_APIGR|nr:hypothetical protein AG4045_030788 [Apium graveolens]